MRKLLSHSGYNFGSAVSEMAAAIKEGWIVHEVIRSDDYGMNYPYYEIVLVRKESQCEKYKMPCF